jgi:hypothetical protein
LFAMSSPRLTTRPARSAANIEAYAANAKTISGSTRIPNAASVMNKRFFIVGSKRSSWVSWICLHCILAPQCLIGQCSILSLEALRLD